MTRNRFASLMVFLMFATLTTAAFAGGKGGGATPLNCVVATFTPGVSSDGSGTYSNGANSGFMKCYFGVSGSKDFDFVTYNSGRKLHYSFGADAAGALSAAGLPSDFMAESDAFGINYWGRYQDMGIGTTAQVQMDLEFHWPPTNNPQTYELDYSCLSATRTAVNQWVVTSEPDGGLGNNYAVPCLTSSAKLNIIRRRTVTTFGVVDMPIRFEVTLQ